MMNEFLNMTVLWAALAFVAVLIVMPFAIRLAVKCGFVDVPGGRKAHESPVPLVGGLVIFPLFMILNTLSGAPLDAVWPLCAGMMLLLGVGAVDDKCGLSPRIKFAAQIAAALLIVFPGEASVSSLGYLFGGEEFKLYYMTIPFSLIATVLLINAINLLDGLDGLSGGLGVLIFAMFLLAVHLSGDFAHVTDLPILIAVLLGFLWFNMRHRWRKRASVFIGDAGSLTLGLLIAWYAMHLGDYKGGVIEPITVAWILALPIFDTCAQFARRIKEKRHPFSPDANHFHHHFRNAGLSVTASTGTVLLIVLVLSLVGVLGVYYGAPLPVLTWSWIVLILVHIAVSLKPVRYQNAIKAITKYCRPSA